MKVSKTNRTLQSRLLSRLEGNPDGRGVLFWQDGAENYLTSFADFMGRSAAYAEGLSALGLKRAEVCIIVLPSGPVAATALCATLLLGAIPLLIAPPSLQAEGAFSSLLKIIQRIVRKTKPALVILPESLGEFRKKLEKGARRTVFVGGESQMPTSGRGFPATVAPKEDDLAAMQLTSGTTGFPRVCVWRQANVVAALDGMRAAMDIGGEDICLNWTPLYHDMGLVNNFLLCLTGDIPLVMLSPNDFIKRPSIWLRALSETRATTTWSPNFGFAICAQRVKDEELSGVNLAHVRGFWNAAERIHFETLVAFHRRFRAFGVDQSALKTNFGCAENIGGATFSSPDGTFLFERIDRKTFLERRVADVVDESCPGGERLIIVGVGRPHPQLRVRILSRNGNVLPDGHVGEIALDTPSRMEGYLGDRRATRRAVHKEVLRTGDLGYTRGGELFWVGRTRERINVRGTKLDPSDFEPVLWFVDGLRHGSFAAFGIDDPVRGTQKIVVVVEVRPATERETEAISGEIRSKVFEHLGVNIDQVLLVRPGTLTKTSSGKRRHRYFSKLYLEGRLSEYEWKPQQATTSARSEVADRPLEE